MKRFTIIFSILMALTFTELAYADTRHISSAQDHTVELSRIHYWANKGCTGVPVVVQLEKIPKHGKIQFQSINSTIGDFGRGRLLLGAVNQCKGKPIQAILVEYIPDPGFTGTDEFTVTAYPENLKASTITWRVEVH